MKKKIVAAASLMAVSLLGVKTNAAVVLSDTFDSYTAGNLVGQGGWAQTSTTTTSPIQVGPATSGNGAVLGTSGQDAYEPFSQAIPHTAGSTLETSMTINLTAAQTAGDYFTHLTDVVGGSSVFLQRLFAKSTTGGYLLGFEATAGGGASVTYGTTVLPLNTDENVDILWNFAAGTTSDTFNISVGGIPYAGLTSVPWGSTLAEPTQLVAANLRQGTAANAPSLTLDNLLVQGTPAVPEPASMSLLVGAGGLALARRRRRA